MSDYRKVLAEKLEINRKKIAAARSLKEFKENVPALTEVIDDLISTRVSAMTGKEPLSVSDYHDAHGGARALIDLRDMITNKEIEAESLEPIVKSQEEQLQQL